MKDRLRRHATAIMTGIVVATLVLSVAVALFAIQYAQAYEQCSKLVTPGPCMSESGLQLWTNGVFASVAGLLAAIVMGITTGVNIFRQPAPNFALARRLAAEDETFRMAEERRAQLRELNAIALSHVVTNQARQEVAKEEAIREARESGLPSPEEEEAMARWEEEKVAEETEAQKRSKALMERMLQVARRNPKAVADIIDGWINQPVRR